MTQIIAVLTKDYALLASDRRLTYADGLLRGQTKEEDECKLVSLCSINTIAYTGLANIEGSPTHRWIATALAERNCNDPGTASRVLQERATNAFMHVPPEFRAQIFLIAGWWQYENPPGLRAHFFTITNLHDRTGRPLAEPSATFTSLLRVLRDEEDLLLRVMGQPLREERHLELLRNVRRLVSREIGPKETLRLLVDEIVNTSLRESNKTVGTKILACCVPRQSAERLFQTGHYTMLAKQPDENVVTFTYFEPGYNEFRQYGPTVTCGEVATTNFKGETDAQGDSQRVEVRILTWPQAGGSSRPLTD
jgi:hypothetical protein